LIDDVRWRVTARHVSWRVGSDYDATDKSMLFFNRP
jgi:hypothetical protein